MSAGRPGPEQRCDPTGAVLGAAGLSTVEEQVYRSLVALVTATAPEVARKAALSESETEAVLLRLQHQGLAGTGDGDVSVFSAVAPDIGLLPRLRRSADALDDARAAVGELAEMYRASVHRRDGHHLIEVITGKEPLRERLRQMQRDAREEMLWLCKADYVAVPSQENHAEFDALSRGVRYQVVYEQDFLEAPGAIEDVMEGVRAGEQARAVARLPVRLAIADRALALCPLVPGGPQGATEGPTAALVRSSSLLEALVALFERFWETGVPLRPDTPPPSTREAAASRATRLHPDDRHLLSLLIAGLTEMAVARHMGLSRRTVQRRVQRLMDLTGAASRMQLAWHAAREGWV
ncbi:TrmB family transcriptional regulator [Streptomyces sp. NPDC056222]|uniref:TrmB family transcriptional regulator n=1 Tax=Streptomyces sp. NPDC056222 TaxID=3345749 RepID=UPI0035D97CC2